MPKLSLYHYWRSSCSWRVRWAFALKGVDYESIPVNILAAEQQADAYKALNPAGLLPALTIDGVPYGESLAILEWIEESWPTPALLPTEPLLRLHVRQLALTIVAGTQPLQNPSLLAHFVPDPAQRGTHAKIMIERGLRTYENLLKKHPKGVFSVGNQVTIADLCLVPQVYNALRFGVEMEGYPQLQEIYGRCLATKECDIAAPHNQPGAAL